MPRTRRDGLDPAPGPAPSGPLHEHRTCGRRRNGHDQRIALEKAERLQEKATKEPPPPPWLRGVTQRVTIERGGGHGPAEEEADQARTKEGKKQTKGTDGLTCWGCRRRCPPGAVCRRRRWPPRCWPGPSARGRCPSPGRPRCGSYTAPQTCPPLSGSA